jgi:hypothetical protein
VVISAAGDELLEFAAEAASAGARALVPVLILPRRKAQRNRQAAR